MLALHWWPAARAASGAKSGAKRGIDTAKGRRATAKQGNGATGWATGRTIAGFSFSFHPGHLSPTSGPLAATLSFSLFPSISRTASCSLNWASFQKLATPSLCWSTFPQRTDHKSLVKLANLVLNGEVQHLNLECHDTHILWTKKKNRKNDGKQVIPRLHTVSPIKARNPWKIIEGINACSKYLNTVIADDVVCELIHENVVDDVDETRCLVAVTR